MDIDTQKKPTFKPPSKSKQTKQYKTTADTSFKKPKPHVQLSTESREARFTRLNNIRKNKINTYLLNRRGIIDADGNSSIDISKNKSMSIANLTQIIDMTAYKTPPKICALIQLNSTANLDAVVNGIETVINDTTPRSSGNFNYKYQLNNNVVTYVIPNTLYKGKERLTFIKTTRDVYSVLDACKVADIVLFVSSCSKCEYDKWQLDPSSHAFAIDEFGYEMLSMLRCQGLTEHMCCVQDLSVIPVKHRNEVKKLYYRFFDSELRSEKHFCFYNETTTAATDGNGNDATMQLNDTNEYKAIIRKNCGLNPFSAKLDISKHRSYMMIEDIKQHENGIHTDVYGYIRGNTLYEGKYVHITGFGDYKVMNVSLANDPLPTKVQHDKGGVNVGTTTTTTTTAGDQMDVEKNNNNNTKKPVVVKDDQIESQQLLTSDNIPEYIGDNSNRKPTTTTTTMGIDIKDLENDLGLNLDMNVNDDDDDNISYHASDYNDDNDDTNNQISNKHKSKTGLQYRKPEDMEFEDEVDTPIETPARERFRKYKGLESLKSGTWDAKENLPKEYKNIFSFDNIKSTYKHAVKAAHDLGLKLSGNYIKITIMNFNINDIQHVRADRPLVLSTLLDHERKLCVMNYKITPYYEQSDDVINNLNKQVMECQCGFRRLLIKPIFAMDVYNGSDKLKFQKKLKRDNFYICTVFSQLTYANSPVLLFTRSNEQKALSLVATGNTMESDAFKVILKKIILTGYPVKIKKKNAVVRYMFFNPNDVNYFKPIQLTTKNGLRGNIKESVGTHGYMKCYFNGFIQSNDTVCLSLYKRVFPVYFKETWRYKVYYGEGKDYLNYFKKEEKESDEMKDS